MDDIEKSTICIIDTQIIQVRRICLDSSPIKLLYRENSQRSLKLK
ncbi:uncharacterized protein G2W53_037292 [Senna tora]|uniref:Uncharacterized protein n=1 Tax=Senna tora TaxID=362788 RepID=A0A834SV31_9FABA|nr:uncharacterized protein G2W53_037292 [Senna tora]